MVAKVVGEEPRSYYPAVSEWGNLLRVITKSSFGEIALHYVYEVNSSYALCKAYSLKSGNHLN